MSIFFFKSLSITNVLVCGAQVLRVHTTSLSIDLNPFLSFHLQNQTILVSMLVHVNQLSSSLVGSIMGHCHCSKLFLKSIIYITDTFFSLCKEPPNGGIKHTI